MDPVEAIWSLADSVRDQTASFNGAKDLEPVEATDEAGVVHVMLDATGKVSDVRVAVGWQDRVSGDALGATIIRAISAAAQKRLVAWADAVVDPDRAVPPARPMQPPLSDSVSGRLTEIATAAAHMPAEAMEEVASTLREMNASLRALRGQMSAVLDARFTAESSSGHARVTVSGSGDMLEVEFDQTWLKYAHPANIGRECVAAMRVAFDAAARKGLVAMVNDSPIGKLAAIADDPEALAERFRLRG